jgi:hypothetical protein
VSLARGGAAAAVFFVPTRGARPASRSRLRTRHVIGSQGANANSGPGMPPTPVHTKPLPPRERYLRSVGNRSAGARRRRGGLRYSNLQLALVARNKRPAGILGRLDYMLAERAEKGNHRRPLVLDTNQRRHAVLPVARGEPPSASPGISLVGWRARAIHAALTFRKAAAMGQKMGDHSLLASSPAVAPVLSGAAVSAGACSKGGSPGARTAR